MFEFHGWARVQYHTHNTDSILQDRCWDNLVEYVKTIPNELVSLNRYNMCDSVFVNGQHNHRSEYVIELFQWIADNSLGSYGILYIRDDEDHSRLSDFENCFRVWRLCRGTLSEHDDPFLSPAIPTVEDPYDPSRGD
ncbi:hypothetical protein CA54_35920 [Symmachiella macrocystis]|uniref:Uncharacterized protein n=1 Tax=Symmachiella macrocystis TaxID=2527985 RepID=A0A5C6BR66_9PLAN|nr:Imm7 family immunity protein [Symmachiella macrocystis]TWU14723.1 hypothetical protein CA54_35920 [Symmachiella macrocystis]